VTLGLLLLLLIVGGYDPASAQREAPTVPAAGKTEAVIGLNDAPAQVEEVSSRLAPAVVRAASSPAVEAIAAALPELAASIAQHVARDRRQLAGGVDLAQLDSMQARWVDDEALLADWDQALKRRGEELDRLVGEVADLEGLWERTATALRSAAAPPPLLARIAAALDAIRDTRAKLTERRDAVLTLRNRVARQRAVVAEARALVGERRAASLGSLQIRDQPSLWRLYREQPAEPVRARVRAAFAGERDDLAEFFSSARAGGPSALAAMGALLAAMVLVARRARAWRAQGHDLAQASLIAERPIAAAIVLWALALPWLHVPMVVRRLAGLILVVPTIRLLGPLLGPLAAPTAGFLVSLLVLDRLGGVLAPVPELFRPVLLLEAVIAMAAVRWFRRTWLQAIDGSRSTAGRWMDRMAFAAGILLVAATVANVLGYLQFADLLGDGVVSAGFAALAAWVLVRVLDGVIAVALGSPPLATLYLVQRNRNRATRNARRTVRIGLAALWVMVVLRYSHLWDLTLSVASDLLGAPIVVGELAFTLGDVLVLVGSLWVSFLVARVVRAVLEEEVLSRLQLPRGIPYAISTFTGYTVLVVGVLMAFVAAGFDLSRIAIVVGALGVGVGLGLQEIVKDLVAGAVLLFERPIQLGDIVQMGDLNGDVRRIGLRSSTVRTFDGAEVIVPNSSFTSSQIVNWTLSNRVRRVDLPVGVAYGTDPAGVIALLEELAVRHPDVLDDPPPKALFMQFGDNALEFQLRVWITRSEQWVFIRSELAVAVVAALAAHGITVPFPQRDVHIRTVDPELLRPTPAAAPKGDGGR
jgi:potassium efflux system protein